MKCFIKDTKTKFWASVYDAPKQHSTLARFLLVHPGNFIRSFCVTQAILHLCPWQCSWNGTALRVHGKWKRQKAALARTGYDNQIVQFGYIINTRNLLLIALEAERLANLVPWDRSLLHGWCLLAISSQGEKTRGENCTRALLEGS